MVATKRQLVPAARKLVSSGRNRKLKICIHDTDNASRGADAQAHANLQSNGNSRAASWHWTVDDKVAIQSYRHNDRCWHSGTSKGNGDAIAVEVCVNSDGDYAKAIANAAELVAKLLKDEKLTLDDVTTHNAYSGADCPRQLRNKREGISWDDFVGMVAEAFDGSKPSKPTPSPSSSGTSKSVSQLAQEVIDGKHGTGDARKRALGSQYDAVQAEVNRRLGVSSTPKKTAQQVAQDIANGRGGWGNDPERSRKLTAAGYNASDVQSRVNRILSGSSSSTSSSSSSPKTAQQVAQDIANGRGGWGNDPDRSRKHRAAGHDAAAVQRPVNQILSGRSSGSSGGSGRLSIEQVARQIINGQGGWGNDPQRTQRLRAAGYDAAAVQRRVNQLAS